MKVLVSGGTGFLGQAIVQKLKQKNHDVLILSRRQSGLGILPGDITKPETLPLVLEGVEVVIQSAQFPGHPFENARKGYTYWEVDAIGTENLVKAAKQAKVGCFIYISGAGTDGKKEEPWFKAKWYAEEAVRNSGIQSTILRPSWVYGPGDKSLNRIIAQAKKLPFLPMIGDGQNRVQPLFVEDLAEIVATSPYLVEKAPFLPGRELEVGGPEEMTMKEMMRTVLKVLVLKRPVLPIPKWLIRPILGKAVDFITMDVPVDTSILKKLYPTFQPKSLKEALKTYL